MVLPPPSFPPLDFPSADAAAAVMRVLFTRDEQEEERERKTQKDQTGRIKSSRSGTTTKKGENWHHHTACLFPWLAGVVLCLPFCSFLPPILPPSWRDCREITLLVFWCRLASFIFSSFLEKWGALFTDWIYSFVTVRLLNVCLGGEGGREQLCFYLLRVLALTKLTCLPPSLPPSLPPTDAGTEMTRVASYRRA